MLELLPLKGVACRSLVWKRRRRSFLYADRVGVALERCPGIPSFCQLACTASRESGHLFELRRDSWSHNQ